MRLRDGDELIVVPNLTVDQFFELRDRARNASSSFNLEKLTVQAVVSEDRADLEANYQYRFDTGEVSADIPLALGSVQVGVEGAEQNFDSDDLAGIIRATETGYRWKVSSTKAVPESPLGTLKLRGKTKIANESGRRTLRILLPVKNCIVNILLPKGALDPRVRMDDFLETEDSPEGLAVSVATRGGDFSLSWRTPSLVAESSTLEAESTTTFDIGVPDDYWDARTDLTLRWTGDIQSKAVRVALPPNSAWRILPADDFDRYRVLTVGSDRATQETELLIENEDPQANPIINLQLEWRWLPVADGADQLAFSTSVKGVTILGADRHTGRILMSCPDSYNVIYKEKSGVRLEEQSSFLDSFSRQRLKFRFTDQSFSLDMLFRQETRIPTVRPNYLVSVEENSLRMTAWLDCTFDSSLRNQTLDILFGMWVPEENTAISLVDADDPYGVGETLQVIPLADGLSYRISRTVADTDLSRGQRRTRQLWRLTAERSWTPDENLLQFSVPEIRKSTNLQPDHCSGSLIVASQGRVLVDWAEAPFRGLIPDEASAAAQKYWVPAKSSRSPTIFRFQTQGQIPTWSGAVSLLPQIVSWSEKVNVASDSQSFSIRQDFNFQIANAPLIQPEFAIQGNNEPEAQFFVDGVLVFADPIGWASDLATYRNTGSLVQAGNVDESMKWRIYRIIDSPPLMGSALLTVQTQRPFMISQDVDEQTTSQGVESESANSVGTKESRAAVAPLAVPILPANSIFNSRTIISSDQIDGSLQFAPGEESTYEIIATDVALSLNKRLSLLKLRKTAFDSNMQTKLRIVDSWLQTAVNLNERQDRYVCVFETKGSSLRFKLPQNASLRPPPRIFLDGVEILDADYDQATETFQIATRTSPLTDSANTTEAKPGETTEIASRSRLELIYSVRNQLENWSRIKVQSPSVEDATHVGRLQWQLATPRLQHLLWASNSNVPEWKWEWSGLWWFRASARGEEALVRQFRASPERLPASFNDYLMSRSDPTTDFEAIVVARSLIWFPAGLLAIGIAVLLISLPVLRQPSIILLAAACVLAISIVSPDLAVLAGQTCFAAGSLAVLAWLTHAALESRVKRRSVFGSRMPQDGSGQTSALRSTRTSQPLESDSAANGRAESSVAAEGTS
ncbi:MAG: hypothetical protein ACE361_20315 [Aureliella sp.]